MFGALWYIIKILAILGLAVFLYAQPGSVVVGWKDYTITLPLGLTTVSILALVFVISSIAELLTHIALWPKAFARMRSEKRRAKGYRALLQSLSAAAIGDQKNAYHLAHRAQKLLPEGEAGLPLLLQAQAQARQGQSSSQDAPYQALLKNADTALLGLHGLTQNAILAGDFGKALLLARQSLTENPKNYALLKAVYDLEIRNHLWNDALVTLEQAEKRKIIPRDSAAHDRVAIFLVLGDMAREAGRRDEAFSFYKKAYQESPAFPPAIVRYGSVLIEDDSRRKAIGIVEKAWKTAPHPSYIPLWAALSPDKQDAKYRWFETLVRLHPDHDLSHLALAEIAISESLWGEAKLALAKAEKIRASAAVYKLWVTLEEKTTNRADVIRQWLDRAYTAPSSGAWVCTKTGKTSGDWHAVVEPEGLFNTLVWNADAVVSAPAPIRGVLTGTS